MRYRPQSPEDDHGADPEEGTAPWIGPGPRSGIRVVRVLTLDEGGHAFGLVVRGQRGVEEAAFVAQPLLESRLESRVDGFLDHRRGDPGLAGDRLRDLVGRDEQLLGFDDPGEETRAFGLL